MPCRVRQGRAIVRRPAQIQTAHSRRIQILFKHGWPQHFCAQPAGAVVTPWPPRHGIALGEPARNYKIRYGHWQSNAACAFRFRYSITNRKGNVYLTGENLYRLYKRKQELLCNSTAPVKSASIPGIICRSRLRPFPAAIWTNEAAGDRSWNFRYRRSPSLRCAAAPPQKDAGSSPLPSPPRRPEA